MHFHSTAPLMPAIAGATLVPPLLAYNQTPAATLYNQLLALVGWGLVLILVRGRCDWRPSAWPLLVGAVLLALAMLMAPVVDVAGLLLLSVGCVLLLIGMGAPRAEPLAEGLAGGLLLTGLFSFAIGALQVFAPAWADGQWIARSGFVGRAVGNVRQPNHLATLLLMAAVGLVLLAQRRRWPTAICVALMATLVGGVVLSASRTGLWFGVPLLLLWGLVDRSLEPRLRWLLIATPLLAGLAWLGMHLWAASGLGVFGAEQRLDREGAGSPSRVKILLNAWSLLMQEPGGVGWGGFNRAWTLSPFPDRPIAFFDHTHNLPMQLLVELGWVGGGLVLLLLTLVAGQALLAAWRARGEAAPLQRAALMLALIVIVHSMLEYPLWYAYFLLPTALALGLALRAEPIPAAAWSASWLARPLGLLMIVGSAWAYWEYRKVVAIYAPPRDAAPLVERIAAGQRSLLFSRHADYAAATALGANSAALAAAQRTGWQLIDARLLIAWAKSLHAVGDTDKARYLVERLREFRSRDGDAWLTACDEKPDEWFCAPPEQQYSWRDF